MVFADDEETLKEFLNSDIATYQNKIADCLARGLQIRSDALLHKSLFLLACLVEGNLDFNFPHSCFSIGDYLFERSETSPERQEIPRLRSG